MTPREVRWQVYHPVNIDAIYITAYRYTDDDFGGEIETTEVLTTEAEWVPLAPGYASEPTFVIPIRDIIQRNRGDNGDLEGVIRDLVERTWKARLLAGVSGE